MRRYGLIGGAPRLIAALAALALAGCSGSPARSPAQALPTPAPAPVPRPSASPTPDPNRPPDHIVVVVLENKASTQIDGSPAAPYLNSLMSQSAVLTRSYAVTHPSEPNYLALFSGSTYGITDDRCPVRLGDAPNLGRQLLDAGFTFTGYSEGLPSAGFTGCSSGRYAAKHSPWVAFGNLPPSVNQPLTALPADFSKLPTVAWIIPDLCGDMHDCSISDGDTWMRTHIDAYAQWALTHHSLLLVTFDEDDNSADNRILTFIRGDGIRPGRYDTPVTHYGVLATIEDEYGLGRLGEAATATTITGISQ